MKLRLPIQLLYAIMTTFSVLSSTENVCGLTDYSEDIIIGAEGYVIPGAEDDPVEINVEGTIKTQEGVIPGTLTLNYTNKSGTVNFKGDMTKFGGMLHINGSISSAYSIKTLIDADASFSSINAWGGGELIIAKGVNVINPGNLDLRSGANNGMGSRTVTIYGNYTSLGLDTGNSFDSGSLSLCDNAVLNLESGSVVTVRRLVTANSAWADETPSVLNVKKGASLNVVGTQNYGEDGYPPFSSVFLGHYAGSSEVNVSGNFDALSVYIYGGFNDHYYAILNVKDGGVINAYGLSMSNKVGKNAVNLEKGGVLNLGGGTRPLEKAD